MTETGKVREINGNSVVIAPDKGAACFGCMNQECRSNGGFITAENSLFLPLKKGQIVEVKAPGSSLLGQALAVLLPPVLGFAAGFILIRFFSPGSGEGAAAGMGVISLFASAFVVYKARQKFPAGPEFTVTKIID